MVADPSGRYKASIRTYLREAKVVKSILEEAQVPRRWYSFKEEENKVCIIAEADGIHIYVPERGKRTGEKVARDWNEAIRIIAPQFEYSCTARVQKTVARLAMNSRVIRDPRFERIKAINRNKENLRRYHRVTRAARIGATLKTLDDLTKRKKRR